MFTLTAIACTLAAEYKWAMDIAIVMLTIMLIMVLWYLAGLTNIWTDFHDHKVDLWSWPSLSFPFVYSEKDITSFQKDVGTHKSQPYQFRKWMLWPFVT